MAAYDEVPELVEELRLLGDEADEARRPASRRLVAGIIAVGLTLAVAATYALAPGRSQTGTMSISGMQGKVEEPSKMGIKQNLGDYISVASVPDEAHPGRLGGSIGSSAEKLFEHVVEKSKVDEELTAQELRAFKFRFIASMVNMESSNLGWHEDYVGRARKHIDGTKPVITEAFAKEASAAQKSFKVVMKPWMLEESMDSLKARLIKVPFKTTGGSGQKFSKSPPPGVKSGTLPANFDAAEHWGRCAAIINNPHNQGRCGSCWVFGALGALDSRMCIATNGVYSGDLAQLSRGFGASCAVEWDGCQGGWPHLVYDYFEQGLKLGIPSSNCVPYFGGEDFADHWSSSMPSPACPTTCDERYNRTMAEDYFNASGVGDYQLVDLPDVHGISALKHALYTGGSVSYAFYANQEFMGYGGGVFDGGCGQQGNHAVQATGWGVESGSWGHQQEFILSLNSWGTEWGLNGRFKVAHCVVWHYVIPGPINNLDFPLPIPPWEVPASVR